MSNKNKILVGILFLILLISGIAIGLVWEDLPYVKFNPELKLSEVANFILTLTLGLVIPFMVKKWIEDNRAVKSALVDEIKNIIYTLNKIKSLIDTCHNSNNISKEQKDDINFYFHESELQINSFEQQLKISFPNECNSITQNLKSNYFQYKDYLTGGELMLSSFERIDSRFYREHKNELFKIETHLKTLIHKIHKL